MAGIVEYPEAIEVMDRLRDDRIHDVAQDTILFLQHPEIVTMGPRARKEGITAEGYSTVDVDRGGGLTWHGPGQLVIYPIIKWQRMSGACLKLSPRWRIGSSPRLMTVA